MIWQIALTICALSFVTGTVIEMCTSPFSFGWRDFAGLLLTIALISALVAFIAAVWGV